MTNDIDNLMSDCVNIDDISTGKLKIPFDEILLKKSDGTISSTGYFKSHSFSFQSEKLKCKNLDKDMRDSAFLSMSHCFEKFLYSEIERIFSDNKLLQELNDLNEKILIEKLRIKKMILEKYPIFKDYTRFTQQILEES